MGQEGKVVVVRVSLPADLWVRVKVAAVTLDLTYQAYVAKVLLANVVRVEREREVKQGGRFKGS